MKQKNTIPTILGVMVLVLGSLAGVFLINNTQIFKIGADTSAAVKNIRIANISDNSINISWTTDKETVGYVAWGSAQGSLTNIENESDNNQKYYNHSVNLSGLSPSTKYFYKINSDGTIFDNSGIPWQITTGPTLSGDKNSLLISGSVINASGEPEKKALVYADIAGYLFATETSETGNFVFQIGDTRTNDLSSYQAIDPAQTLIQLSVQAVPNGVASAQIFPQSANPAPVISIGQSYDFRNEPINNLGLNPSANLNLPEDELRQSKFNVAVSDATPQPNTVVLESLNEGETITSTQPEFFGKGPEGSTLTITVHSENPVTGSVQVPSNGSWKYSVPSDLEPGNHTITISWIDFNGITRFLTRGFVVSAGEVPAFTASGSGSTPTATPTIRPSNTPAATVVPTATSSATPVASASSMPIPVTGDLSPTLLLLIMGIGVTVFSLIIWKVSSNEI